MCLTSLDLDCLAYILNNCHLSARDVANVRLSTARLKYAVEKSLQAVEPVTGDGEALGVLLHKLPALKHLALGSQSGLFAAVTLHTWLAECALPLAAELANLSRLTSLSLSTADLQHFGRLKWAHKVCAQQQVGSVQQKPPNTSMWYRDEYAQFATESQHQVYWLPDWLAAPPGLQKLVLQPPAKTRFHGCAHLPACLWFKPSVWADKLTHLELHGVALQRYLPPGLAQLTGLHTLGLTCCCLQPAGVAQLLRQVVQGGMKLRVLLLRSNDLLQLPSHGWQALDGLQELDLSHNQLMDIPTGLSHLTDLRTLQLHHNQIHTLPTHLSTLQKLQLFDVSHNWLSGFSNTPHIGDLVTCWQQLQVLRVMNVSDKRGPLVLPIQLGQCSMLRELDVSGNYQVEWRSLELLLDVCQDLRVVDVSGVDSEGLPEVSRLWTAARIGGWSNPDNSM